MEMSLQWSASNDPARVYNQAMSTAQAYSPLMNMRRIVTEAALLDQRNKIALDERTTLEQRPSGVMPSSSPRFSRRLSRHQTNLEIYTPAKTEGVVGAMPAILKFRRKAKAVVHVIRLCRFYATHLSSSIKREPWFALMVNVTPINSVGKRQKRNPFIKLMQDKEDKSFSFVTFDAVDFSRPVQSEGVLTDSLREILRKPPGTRTDAEVALVVRRLNVFCPSFSVYSLSTQLLICRSAFYDTYSYNRVLYQKHRPPHGIYFVLSGVLIERLADHKSNVELVTGDVFGIDEIENGYLRQSTVVTKTMSELAFLHKSDYKTIFGMVEDARARHQLDVCRHDVVFQHFPMNRLEDNPGTWNVWKYNHGKLIARDSNAVDCIYVVTSGEARVVKRIETNGDVGTRRGARSVMNQHTPYSHTIRILNFISNADKKLSVYNRHMYIPGTRTGAVSAPPRIRLKTPSCVSVFDGHKTQSLPMKADHTRTQVADPERCTLPGVATKRLVTASKTTICYPKDNSAIGSRQLLETKTPKSAALFNKRFRPSAIHTSRGNGKFNDLSLSNSYNAIQSPIRGFYKNSESLKYQRHDSYSQNAEILQPHERFIALRENNNRNRNDVQIDGEKIDRNINKASNDTFSRMTVVSAEERQTDDAHMHRNIAPIRGKHCRQDIVSPRSFGSFVQVDVLRPGQVFGFRSCLDPAERGPSVSLVSGECEMLQIDKRFFLKHSDDAILSIIRTKTKPYPSHQELLSRLDANVQWSDYKRSVISDLVQDINKSKHTRVPMHVIR